MRNNFEYASDGVAGFQHGIDLALHFFLGGGVDTAQGRFHIVRDGENFFPARGTLDARVSDLYRVASDFRSQLPQ